MKTADLIPFILLELSDCDKYGFELTKNIETKSEGKIVIKQPTLYTLLKKLEKSKFITSYWQDSEIGGKRHYYKLTENGKLQVSTMPSYSFLLNNALNEDNENEENNPSSEISTLPNTPTPSETILPTNEIFSESNIDGLTEFDINLSNTQILKDDNTTENELFATSKDVVKFTEKIPQQTPVLSSQSSPISDEFLNLTYPTDNNDEIKYIEYEDFKNSENYIYAKKISSKLVLKSLITSASLFVLIVVCGLITSFCGTSVLYYLSFFSSIIIAIFYPVLTLFNLKNLKKKYRAQSYKLNFDKKLILRLCLLLLILIICTTVSICLDQNTIFKLLHINNFANQYAPTILSLALFVDLLLDYKLFSKIK